MFTYKIAFSSQNKIKYVFNSNIWHLSNVYGVLQMEEVRYSVYTDPLRLLDISEIWRQAIWLQNLYSWSVGKMGTGAISLFFSANCYLNKHYAKEKIFN